MDGLPLFWTASKEGGCRKISSPKTRQGLAMSIPRIYTDETGPVDRMDEP